MNFERSPGHGRVEKATTWKLNHSCLKTLFTFLLRKIYLEDVSRAEKEGKMVCGALSTFVAYCIKKEENRA